MVVTALILTVVNIKNNRGEMTDAQIRERAAQLGMVDANSYSLTDAAESSQTKTEEKTDDVKTEEKTEEKTEVKSEEKTETEEEKKDTESEDVKPEETEEAKSEETEEVKPEENEETQPEETKPEEPQETEPEDNKQQPSEGEATITIQNGSSSETACMLLKNAGLIESADDLNRYMIQHGYDRTIHPGTFTLPYGLSFEEICKKIAG